MKNRKGYCPRKRKGKVRRRGRTRNTKRKVGSIPTAAGLKLKPFTPAISKEKRKIGTVDRFSHLVLTLNHYSLTLSLLKVFIAVCLSAVYRSQATPLASSFSWLDDLQLPTAQPFCVDRKPDPANWTYKSLYRGDIAKYYTYECKSAIAL